jgi:hypothetical protein
MMESLILVDVEVIVLDFLLELGGEKIKVP